MKKSLLLTSVLPAVLLSYELEFGKSFSENIQNDTIGTNITISVNAKNINYVNEKIEYFQDFINDESGVVKENGNYSLLPSYSYENKYFFKCMKTY